MANLSCDCVPWSSSMPVSTGMDGLPAPRLGARRQRSTQGHHILHPVVGHQIDSGHRGAAYVRCHLALQLRHCHRVPWRWPGRHRHFHGCCWGHGSKRAASALVPDALPLRSWLRHPRQAAWAQTNRWCWTSRSGICLRHALNDVAVVTFLVASSRPKNRVQSPAEMYSLRLPMPNEPSSL